jgi:hypothetical protein
MGKQESYFNIIVRHGCVESRQALLCAPGVHLGSMLEKPATDLAISGTRSQE